MKYIIFGRQSWLGGKIDQSLKADGHQGEIYPADITDLSAVRAALDWVKPDMVINCAGKTGHPNIDWCEDHKPETFVVNTVGPLNIMTACQERGLYMVHLSSGCIYDNAGYDKPLTEEAPASPPSFYSWTKLWADEVLKNFPVLIVRLRMPIDSQPNPRNLITKLSKYPKIIDVENSATIVDDLLVAIKGLTAKRCTGIYNVTNPGSIKHREIMAMYLELVDPKHKFEMIPAADLLRLGLAKAGRSNCILSTAKLEKEGIHLRPIKEAMRETLIKYAELMR